MENFAEILCAENLEKKKSGKLSEVEFDCGNALRRNRKWK